MTASGCQTPRIWHAPVTALIDHPDNPGQLAIDLADSAGLHLDPWQQLVLRYGMALDSEAHWASFEVGLVVPRQNGKGSVLEALELASLFLPEPDGPPPLILHSAHEFKTSAEHFRRMRDLIVNAPHLNSQVSIIRTAAGAEAIELKTGARLRFVTRTGGSGRGFSADLIVVDEAFNLTPDAMGAVLPTMSARPNPQVWYTSSAGMEASEQLARVRHRGIAGTDRRLTYLEWSAPDGVDPDDRDMWRLSNPALGIRIPESFIEAERDALPPEQFARERLGIWAPVGGDIVIQPQLWAELADSDSTPLDPVVFALAVNPNQDAASIVTAGRRADNLAHIEVVDSREGTGWVVPRFVELVNKWSPQEVVLDASGPASSLLPELTYAGVEVRKASTSDYAVACGAFLDSATNHGFRHRPSTALDRAVAAGRKRPLAERWAWGRKGYANITPLEAASLALWALPPHRTYNMLDSVM